METIKIQFGKHLRKLRQDRGLTQEELADRAGLHFAHVGQIERGLRNSSLVNLYKFARGKLHRACSSCSMFTSLIKAYLANRGKLNSR